MHEILDNLDSSSVSRPKKVLDQFFIFFIFFLGDVVPRVNATKHSVLSFSRPT